MRKIVGLSMAVLLLMSFAGPSTADPLDLAELHTVRTYFHCADDIKVANVSAVANATEVSWDTTAPTTSFQQGGGCGHADTNLTGTADHNALYDAPFHGSYDGAIDSITFTVDAIDVGFSRVAGSIPFRLHLQIDGRDVVARDDSVIYDFQSTPSSTGLTDRITFTVTNIGLIYEKDDKPHDIRATLYSHYLDGQNQWVFDATEIDGGLTFNPEKPEFDRIKGIRLS